MGSVLQLSVAKGRSICNVRALDERILIDAGQLISGTSLSITVTLKLHCAVLPEASSTS